MSTEMIPDKAFFSWLDEHIKWACEWADDAVAQGNESRHSYAVARVNALREVRAYFGGAS